MQENHIEFLEELSDQSSLDGFAGSIILLSSSGSSTFDTLTTSPSIASVGNDSIGSMSETYSSSGSFLLDDSSSSLIEDSFVDEGNDFDDHQFAVLVESADMVSQFSADSSDSHYFHLSDGEPSSGGEDTLTDALTDAVTNEITPAITDAVPGDETTDSDEVPVEGPFLSEDNDVTRIEVADDKPSVSGTQSQTKAAKGSHKRRADTSLTDDEDGQMCSICMDTWSNSGDHRLSSLRCGHLFGYKCIVHWLGVSKSRGMRRCPQCNKSAKVSDVRVLYAKKLISVDTSDQDAIKVKLEAAEKEKNKLEVELKKVELKNQLQEKQLAELRSKLAKSSQAVDMGATRVDNIATQGKTVGIGEVRLVLHHSQEINKDGGCRVMAYKESHNLIVISQLTASLFTGYGINKVNSLNFRSTQFIYLHSKAIRDLAFHTTDNDLLLSVSLDRFAKLLDVSSNNVVQTFQTDSPLWSCSWDVDNSNIFFVGGQNGCVLQYDMRQTGGPISRLTNNTKAVLSLASVPSTPGGALPRGGFLSCHLDSCWAYERINAEYVGKQLPLDGPFVAMRYDRLTDHVLLSSRPSARSLRARHVVCELDRLPATNSLTCNELQTFSAGTTQNLLSRPCLMKLAGYGSVVVAHNESSNTLAMWNMANGARVCNQPAKEPVLDICPVYANGHQYLGTISEKTFRVYRVVI